jgi:hypothetical protein
MSNPPAKWFTEREEAAQRYEESDHTEAAENFRNETSEIAKAYAADDPAAKLLIAVDLREASFTDADSEAREAVMTNPAASARFKNWSGRTADSVVAD